MYMHEIALLVAAVSPVVVVAGIDVYLALNGETDTLLLPRILAYPSGVVMHQPVSAKPEEVPVHGCEPAPLRKAA